MSLYNKIKLAVFGFTLVILAAPVQAQFFQPLGPIDYYHNFQPFAPVELGFGNTPQPPTDGYFFNYDKLLWAATAGRTVVGSAEPGPPVFPVGFGNIGGDYKRNPISGATTLATSDPAYGWPVNSEGDPRIPNSGTSGGDDSQYIHPPIQHSTLRDALPKATFGGGDRYEFGYVTKNRGWLVGILDGPKFDRSRDYGAADFNDLYNIQPEETEEAGEQEAEEDSRELQWKTGNQPWFRFYHPDGFDIVKSDVRTLFGDIYVHFEYEAGLMHGWVDILSQETGGEAGDSDQETNYRLTDSDGDGIIDGDGIADDVDRDGQFGPDGFAEDGVGLGPPETGLKPDFGPPHVDYPVEEPEQGEIASNLVPDYDDLVELPTNFGLLTVRSYVNMDGIELMRTHILSNRRYMAKKQNNQLFLAYGARYLRFSDEFNVDGSGGVLGYSHWYTSIVNNLVGPQVSLRWQNQRGRWSTSVQGRGMLGYNISNWKQNGGIGLNLVRGHYNQPLYLNPTTFEHGQSRGDLSPLAELRLDASYQISKAVAFRVGYTGFFVANIRRAHSGVKYYLPMMGFREGNRETVFVNGANFGFEVNY